MPDVTHQRVCEALARAEAATGGSWTTVKPTGEYGGFATGVIIAGTPGRQVIWAEPEGGSFPAADQKFIAHSRNDVPDFANALLAAWERIKELEAGEKRFLIFAGGDYYPMGGWRDYAGAADTIEAAEAVIEGMRRFDWWQIVDRQTMQIIGEDR